MIRMMNNLFDKLKCPHLVASFQQSFGIVPHFGRTEKTDYFSYLNYRDQCNGSYDSANTPTGKTQDSSYLDNDLRKGKTPKVVYFDVKSKFWYYLFLFGAALGYEVFYATFFPLWFWNIDGAIGRRMVLLWAISMYIGQSLKDIIKWPR